jgi:dihydropyrimidine dehydrogenase (NAD+) subunit PreT
MREQKLPVSFLKVLPAERVEKALADQKPRMTAGEAHLEGERCLYCADAPCTRACPTGIDVPGFIKRIASGNLRGSARTIFEQNILGYSCARVCPVEVLCEGACVYTAWMDKPIAIGRLQRFATETALDPSPVPLLAARTPTGKRAVCVGAGPASLAFAATLALQGHQATVLEKRALPGGLNATGVAPYKLHVEDALREVAWVQSLGVEMRTGVEVGRDVSGAELLAAYDAVFLGLGLGDDTRLGIPGEEGPGVVGATAWIEAMKVAPGERPRLGRVVVVGGGNTAIDVARECALLGADEVTMVYRRGATAMSGYAHEMNAARKEGVRLVLSARPVAVVRDAEGAVQALRVSLTAGAATPVAGPPSLDGGAHGGERHLPCHLVVLAIGQSPLRAIAREFPGVALDAHGRVVADAATGATGHPRVFSGGDCVNGGKEVVHAVAEGRNAARYLHATWSRPSPDLSPSHPAPG